MENVKDKKVVVGGTFDVLHRGHKAFLRKAFSLGKVCIGLTSRAMAQRRKKRKVRSFSQEKDLVRFIKEEFKSTAKIVKIEDEFGPTLKEDFDYIVVSPGTFKTAVLINKIRKSKKKGPIKIVKIKFVLAQDGKPISATRILKGEINENGKLLKSKK